VYSSTLTKVCENVYSEGTNMAAKWRNERNEEMKKEMKRETKKETERERHHKSAWECENVVELHVSDCSFRIVKKWTF